MEGRFKPPAPFKGRKESCSSARNNQADEQAGITHLSWQLSSRSAGRNLTAQLAIVKQMSRQESCSSAGPYHVTEHPLFTWLIINWSGDWSCTDHVAIMHWSRGWSCTDHVADHARIRWLSCTDQVAIMHWSRDCPCTDHVDDHTLFTWLIIHWSRDCTCTDHVIVGNDHVAIMHWSPGWSCTDHMADHTLITWLIMH